MEVNLEIILLITLSLCFLLILGWAVKTEKRLRKFFAGKKAKDLEENIFLLERDISKLEKKESEIGDEISEIKKKLKKSVRGLEIIRFNPFPDQGSNQSFAVGMLNEDGDGLVLSSLYSRERMSIFAKPVKAGKSEYELTKEEKDVLKKAEVK